ncbi:hypothetical protein [Streptomyces pseudogriseolus]|uniref:hypothetical protein n=1 Tax=Streptomyces pseudogriseolus TaxID=36817 RepID=UPI003FA2E22B
MDADGARGLAAAGVVYGPGDGVADALPPVEGGGTGEDGTDPVEGSFGLLGALPPVDVFGLAPPAGASVVGVAARVAGSEDAFAADSATQAGMGSPQCSVGVVRSNTVRRCAPA